MWLSLQYVFVFKLIGSFWGDSLKFFKYLIAKLDHITRAEESSIPHVVILRLSTSHLVQFIENVLPSN